MWLGGQTMEHIHILKDKYNRNGITTHLICIETTYPPTKFIEQGHPSWRPHPLLQGWHVHGLVWYVFTSFFLSLHIFSFYTFLCILSLPENKFFFSFPFSLLFLGSVLTIIYRIHWCGISQSDSSCPCRSCGEEQLARQAPFQFVCGSFHWCRDWGQVGKAQHDW